MMHSWCSTSDRNSIFQTLALIESLQEYGDGNTEIFIVCLDEISRTLLKNLAPPQVITVPVHLIETGDASLIRIRRERSLIEYLWCCVPTMLLSLLENYPDVEQISYITPQSALYASPADLYTTLKTASVVLSPHRFPQNKKHLERWGRYSSSFFSVRRDDEGFKGLRWWREKSIDCCALTTEDSQTDAQIYLNDIPRQFNGVVELSGAGTGVAPWNHSQYRVSRSPSGEVLVNNEPLIFYHFHSFRIFSNDCFAPLTNLDYAVSEEILRFVTLPYIERLRRGIEQVQKILPSYAFGFQPGNDLMAEHSFIASQSLTEELNKLELPQRVLRLSEEWTCFASTQLQESQVLFSESNPH